MTDGFPIQDGPSISWAMIQAHEKQAECNHGQSLERLAERGGLGCYEAICVLEDRAIDVQDVRSKSDDEWRELLQAKLDNNEPDESDEPLGINLGYWEY